MPLNDRKRSLGNDLHFVEPIVKLRIFENIETNCFANAAGIGMAVHQIKISCWYIDKGLRVISTGIRLYKVIETRLIKGGLWGLSPKFAPHGQGSGLKLAIRDRA